MDKLKASLKKIYLKNLKKNIMVLVLKTQSSLNSIVQHKYVLQIIVQHKYVLQIIVLFMSLRNSIRRNKGNFTSKSN